MSEHWRQEERLFLHLGNERNTGGSGRRYFSRGGVKYALLELLAHEDMHGYQMMKALEEQSGGTYKPSAGSIYPTLQMLRDQGFVESYKQDGKRIFQITPEGRLYLQEEMERPEQEREREPDPEAEQYPEQEEQSGAEAGDKITYSGGPNWEPMERGSPEEGDARPEGVRRNRRLTPRGKELIHLLKAAERSALADATKAARLRAVLEELRHSLRLIVGDAAASLGGADAGDGGGAATAGAHGQEAREAEAREAEAREAGPRHRGLRHRGLRRGGPRGGGPRHGRPRRGGRG